MPEAKTSPQRRATLMPETETSPQRRATLMPETKTSTQRTTMSTQQIPTLTQRNFQSFDDREKNVRMDGNDQQNIYDLPPYTMRVDDSSSG